ncbi:hypothetical protein ACFVZ4_11950 [Streptomyces goshikiensis]|uniref:hypothetical protein n=1 Tax=Streptomyces goshikiensis TaxID=1942 RepID=UPI0036C3AD14
MTANTALRFERIRTKGDHRDLRLRIGAYRHTCDSYYFGLDDSPAVRGGMGARLAHLLEQWAAQVEGLRRGGGTAYLPYDFSDQCTAWLRVSSRDGETVEVQAGWSLIEAWGIEPSNYLATAPEVTDFGPIAGARISCSLDDLTACIAANGIALEATGP